MSTHHLLADIWNHLEKRTDIDNILRELIGQHALESAVSGGDLGEGQTFQFVVSLKILFDLQRVYLQSLNTASHTLFLHIPQIFLAVSYLLQIKPSIVSRHGPKEEMAFAERSFLLQTILSGFRLLLLRHHIELLDGNKELILSSDNLRRLRGSCKSWDEGERTDVDKFVMDVLCESILDDLGGVPISDNSQKPRSEVDLPDYSQKLYPIESRFGGIVSNVERAVTCLHEKKSTWLGHYLVLYDVFWGTAAASIKFYADKEKSRKDSIMLESLRNGLKDLIALRTFREDIFESIYRVQQSVDAAWYTLAIDSVVDGLLPFCFQDECHCFKEVFLLQDDQTRLESYVSTQSRDRIKLLAPVAESSLRRFLNSLISREQALTDCNGHFKRISDMLSEDMRTWGSSGSDDTRSVSVASRAYSIEETVFILPCRKAHPISSQELRLWIDGTESRKGLEALDQKEPEFDVDVDCRMCDPECAVTWVRQVVPLSRLSNRLQDLLSTSPIHHGDGSQDRQKQHKIEPMVPRKNPSELRLNVPSPSLDVRSKYSPLSPPIGFLSITEELPMSLQSYLTRSVRIYQILDAAPIRDLPIIASVESIAISPDDQFVAITQGRSLTVFDLDKIGISYKHTLPELSRNCTLDTQKISFSSDSKYIIVATRDRHSLRDPLLAGRQSGTVKTYVSDCTHPNISRNFITDVQTGQSPDLGVTSALYTPTTDLISLTFFTEHTPPHLLSLSSPKICTIEKTPVGRRIQCASMSPSGSELVLLNARNEIFWIHNPGDARRIERLTSLSRPPVNKRGDVTACGMAGEEGVCFFWIEERRGVLTRVGRDGVKETSVFGSLL